MPKELNSLYVYGIVITTERRNWAGVGLEGSYVFMLAEGSLIALVHKCRAEPYTSSEPNKVKELVISHNIILEKAIEIFGGVLPFSFNTIIKGKDGKSAEENLRGWLRTEKSRLEQAWEKIKGRKEYGIKFFYDQKYWLEDIKAKAAAITSESTGINYLLKGKQDYEAKDMLIKKISQRRQELLDAIKFVVQEVKVEQPKVKLMEDKRETLLYVSVLADEQQFNELKQYLRGNMNPCDYRLAGPFPPYSFANGDIHD